jgi:hypothetical protein
MRIAVVTCLTVSLSHWVIPLSAQQSFPVEPGSRLRITAPDCGAHKQTVTFEAVSGDTLVATGDAAVRCPLTAVTRLELHQGRRSNPLRGTGIGFLVGRIGFSFCPCEVCCPETGLSRFLGCRVVDRKATTRWILAHRLGWRWSTAG